MSLLERERITARSDGIDMLRIGLALWVVLSHLAEWGVTSSTGTAGWLQELHLKTATWFQAHGETHPAVVAFIVLSGYCIHRNGGRLGSWDVRGYAIRRWFRIYPVYFIGSLLGVTVFLIAVAHNASATEISSGTTVIDARGLLLKLSAVTALLPISNMGSNPVNGYEGNGVLYTVAAEMWLYAFYAGAITLLVRRQISERGLVGLVVALFSVGLVVSAVPLSLRDWWFNASVLSFLPLWWIGASTVGQRPSRRLALVSGLLWAVCTAYLRHRGSLIVEEVRLMAFGCVVAQVVCVIDRARVTLPKRIADCSGFGYSLYAFHCPTLVLLIAFGVAWPVALLAALVIGQTMYRLVERPTTIAGSHLAKHQRGTTATVTSA